MKRWTLQSRLTFFVGAVLLSVCLLLTVNSLFSANTYYGDYAALIESGQAEIDPTWEAAHRFEPGQISAGEFYREATRKFSTQAFYVMLTLVILGVVLTYWGTGRILRPLRKLTESVQTMDDSHLSDRVLTEESKGDVLVLAEAFNMMLDRLENSFSVQKRFAANAAHELKTPLAVIKSSLQVLQLSPQPSEKDYQEFIADTDESLERLIKTVEGLLSLTHLECTAKKVSVDLHKLCDQVVRELSGLANEREIAITVCGQATMIGEAHLLYRAIYNLVENAIKYNREGGTVNVILEQTEDNVNIKVDDTGTGIAAEALPHIFEAFYRADPSRSQTISGSGLGLALVKLIVEQHGGTIWVHSQIAEGTSFEIKMKR